MFGWGSTIHGELGLGGVEVEHVLTPTELDWYLANTVIEAALGDNHTLLLTNDGQVYSCGCNDHGQLGHEQSRKRPQLVNGLSAQEIIHVACGSVHSIALNRWGQLFSWGSDYHGQLGHQIGETIQYTPKIIKELATYHFVQICCGQRHSMALTDTGVLFCWGANDFGQLGQGNISPSEGQPTVLTSLQGVPIAFIACGANHCFAVSKSGAVFGWGKNTRGQLGLNDTRNRGFPSKLRTLLNIRVRYIACGEEFSVFLTQDGGVFTCGAGMYGQLGHGTTNNEILPRQVAELMGSTTTQIACGRQHSLCLVPSRGRVYSFGIGGSGQLGVRKTASASTPQTVLGPWVSPSGVSLVPITGEKKFVIHRIFAGGDHSLVSVVDQKDFSTSYDCRIPPEDTKILVLTREFAEDLSHIPAEDPVDQDVLMFIEKYFSSVSCINGSFLLDNGRNNYCSSRQHGVDFNEAEAVFSSIGRVENQSIQEVMRGDITSGILPKLFPLPPDVESLRVYLTLPFYHEFNNPRHYKELQCPFASSAIKLSPCALKVLVSWWCYSGSEYFEKLINIYKTVVSYSLRVEGGGTIRRIIFRDHNLAAALDMLALLNRINYTVEGHIVPHETFYIRDISECLDVTADYTSWLHNEDRSRLYLCNYPFLFDAIAKVELLRTDQQMQMRQAVIESARNAFRSVLINASNAVITNFVLLTVSREKIVSDALRELSILSPEELKKPLRVKFFEEEAEDAGGVTREFFLLLLREILDPKYGVFKEYEETRAIWFSENSFEEKGVYFLIGMIFGLAIYNFIIIDVPFPLALYKKLLNEPIGLSDLGGLSPVMVKSLQCLLDYEGDDVEEVFSLTFDVTQDVFGETVTVSLKPNESNVPVTHKNKKEYVDLLVNYYLNESVKYQFQAFCDGFMKVCGDGTVIKLFHSHELIEVVTGNENYDWHALEEAAQYANGYKSSDQVIRWFWEVIHEMSLGDKKKFLLFLTGSYRIPIHGMGAVKIHIQPTSDDKFLPVAHTCFNLLDLPRYNTKERLRYKLMQAIQHTEGFTLV